MTRETGERRVFARAARRALVLPLALAFVLSGEPPFAGVPAAEAQERPRTIMDMLFGPPPARRAPGPRYIERRYLDDGIPDAGLLDGGYGAPQRIERRKPKPPHQAKPARSTKPRDGIAAASAAGTAALAGRPAGPAAPVEKSPSAKTVLVVGDFMAGSLASGLVETLAANPGVKVETSADGSSGLVRDDHFDWVSGIGPLIEKRRPAVVVVMLGSNDSQTLNLGTASLAPRSPEWLAEYARRADAFAAAVEAKSVPLVWVGMPSFRFERMSKDMALLNELYRKASGSVGGDFVDVWDGFVDANGAFSYSGPDITGQEAKLRNADGITMTPDGAEKLAFFAQKPILRLLGPSAIADVAAAAPGVPSAPAAAVRPANATSAPLVSFSDPALDGGDALLGGSSSALAAAEPSPRERLVVSGERGAAPAGRADGFDWSGKTEAVAPLRGTDGVVSRGSVELQTLRNAQGIRPPKDMPSLADAIIADWQAQNAAEAAAKGRSDAPAATRPPTAGSADPAASAAPAASTGDGKPL